MHRYMPHFRVCDPKGETYIAGQARSAGGRKYDVRLCLPPDYPHESPGLHIVRPETLRMYGGGTINSLGFSGAFHTLGNGPNGCVTVCHTPNWDASLTWVKVLRKLSLWLEAYELHLKTGEEIARYLVPR
ncbi:MAG: hypothetical protein QUV05_20140 [Phycisphaerae bacterium]|nr:hypothetical protein [Phycisphaerae bacterium]